MAAASTNSSASRPIVTCGVVQWGCVVQGVGPEGCPRRVYATVEPECYPADRKSMAQPGIGPRIAHGGAFGPASAVRPVRFLAAEACVKDRSTRKHT